MKRVMVFGDSNSWGFNPKDGSRYERRWPKVMEKELGEGWEVIEECISGRTTMWEDCYVPCRCGKTGLFYALASQAPLDMIIFSLGLNDLKFIDAIGSCKGIEELLRVAKHADDIIPLPNGYPIYPNGLRLLLACEAPLSPDVKRLKPYSSLRDLYEESRKIPTYYQAIAKKHNIDFFDMGSLFEAPEAFDGIHLSEEQHILIGKAMTEKVMRMFG